MSVDRIIDTIDAGAGRAAGWAAPVNQTSCARDGCGRGPEVGHDFCSPCLAWLRFLTDEDPLEKQPPEESIDPEDDYYAWVHAMCGY